MATIPSAFTGASGIGPVTVTGTALAGSQLTSTSGTAASWSAIPTQVQPANPASTVSTTLVMMGLGAAASPCVYTPRSTGLVQVNVTCLATTATAAVSLTLGCRTGTGAAPANGAAVSGTRFGGAADVSVTPPGIGLTVPVSFTALLSLTLVANWFDIALLTSAAADAASITNVTMTFEEL